MVRWAERLQGGDGEPGGCPASAAWKVSSSKRSIRSRPSSSNGLGIIASASTPAVVRLPAAFSSSTGGANAAGLLLQPAKRQSTPPLVGDDLLVSNQSPFHDLCEAGESHTGRLDQRTNNKARESVPSPLRMSSARPLARLSLLCASAVALRTWSCFIHREGLRPQQ